MKIGKMVAAVFAIGFGSSCAYAQTASTAAQLLPSSAQTTTATTATFMAVVAQVNTAAGTISLTQTLPAKPTAASAASTDSPTATADYQASPVLLNQATVGAIVQATVQRINGNPALITLRTGAGVFSATPVPQATASSTPTQTSSVVSNPAVSNPARLTPAGVP